VGCTQLGEMFAENTEEAGVSVDLSVRSELGPPLVFEDPDGNMMTSSDTISLDITQRTDESSLQSFQVLKREQSGGSTESLVRPSEVRTLEKSPSRKLTFPRMEEPDLRSPVGKPADIRVKPDLSWIRSEAECLGGT